MQPPLENPLLAAEAEAEKAACRRRAGDLRGHARRDYQRENRDVLGAGWQGLGGGGTHTHVQTADERILAGGTGCLTDAGMRPEDSVLGRSPNRSFGASAPACPRDFPLRAGRSGCGVVADVDLGDGAMRGDCAL